MSTTTMNFMPTMPMQPMHMFGNNEFSNYTFNDFEWSNAPLNTFAPVPAPAPAPVPSKPIYKPTLQIRQHPKKGGVPKKPRHNNSIGDRCEERKPLDPPPVIEINMDEHDPDKDWRRFSPHLFVKVALIKEVRNDRTGQVYQEVVPNGLSGQTTYSIWSDTKNSKEFFVLSDLTVRQQGPHRLRIMLHDITMDSNDVPDLHLLEHVDTDIFDVVAFGKFKPDSPTLITEGLSSQGAKVKKARQKGPSKGTKRDFDQVSP